MKNKTRIFAAVVMMVVLMCCPLVALAAGTTDETVETEEDLSFEAMVEEVTNAFEKKHDNAFVVNYYVFENFAELEEHWRGGMKSNEILIGVVRNTSDVRLALGSRVGVEEEALQKKIDDLDYASYELWEEWAFDVLRVFLTEDSYKLLETSPAGTNEKETFIDNVQSGLFKFGNTIMWFAILFLVLISLLIFMKIMKTTQEWLLARSQRMAGKEKRSRALIKAEEKRDLAKYTFETEEHELNKLETQLKKLKVQKEIECITSSKAQIAETHDSEDKNAEHTSAE